MALYQDCWHTGLVGSRRWPLWGRPSVRRGLYASLIWLILAGLKQHKRNELPRNGCLCGNILLLLPPTVVPTQTDKREELKIVYSPWRKSRESCGSEMAIIQKISLHHKMLAEGYTHVVHCLVADRKISPVQGLRVASERRRHLAIVTEKAFANWINVTLF